MDLPPERHAQLSCFTFAQALAAGCTKPVVATAIRRGRWVVLRRGVYIAADDLAALDDRGRHLATVQAEQLALGPHWFAARRSAAVVYDVPLIGGVPQDAQLLAPSDLSSARPRTRHQRNAPLPLRDRWQQGSLSVVSPQRMLCDIARDEPFRNAVVLGDAVLRRGLPREALEDCCRRMARWPGVIQARSVVAFADGRAESPLESISRCAMHALGIEPPELQVEIWFGDQLLGRVDFLWRAFNTVGEADGFGKYGLVADDRSIAWRAQKRRDEWLQDVGFEVPHWGWDEAWRPSGVLDARLRRAFERGRRHVLDPRVWFAYPDGRRTRAA